MVIKKFLACWKFGTNKKEAEREGGERVREREEWEERVWERERGIKSDERVSRNRVGSETL